MSLPRNRHIFESLLLLVAMIWGSTFVAQQIGMARGIGPMTFNALRFTLGSLSLIPVMLWRARRSAAIGPGSPWLLRGALLAGLFLFAGATLQQIGLQYTSSANAGFITGLYLVLVPLLGMGLGHRTDKSLWVGVVLALAGLYLLSITRGFHMKKGDALVLVGALMWTGQILVIDYVAARGDAVKIAFVQFALCSLLSAVAALSLETSTLAHLRAGAGAVIYAGLLSVGVAFTLQVVCQKRCPPGPAALIMSMEAVFAALSGWLVLHQTLTLRALAGCALILSGALVVQLVPLAGKGAVS